MVIPWVVGGGRGRIAIHVLWAIILMHAHIMLVRSLRLRLAVIVVDCHQSFSAPYPSLPYGKYMVSMIGSTD